MITKHTLKPWIFEKHEQGIYYGNIIGSYGKSEQGFERIRTITVQLKHGTEEENEANAKLIAAAPDLLEACQEFIKVINRSPTAMEHYGEAIKIAELAIKKAT